jgi:hypothetical protein
MYNSRFVKMYGNSPDNARGVLFSSPRTQISSCFTARRLVHPLRQDLTGARQFETAREAVEQRNAKFLLQCSHAMADRTLRQMQFVCGSGETHMTCSN